MQAVAALVNTLDAKDNYTSRHSAAVAQWATELAGDMGLSEHEVELTHLAGLMHDVGKIGIPDRVLKGEGSLDETDRAIINTHSAKGAEILEDIDDFREVARVILYHHERYDGRGYPFGAAGEDIPLISRIIGVADSYSAMMSDRPYRDAAASGRGQGATGAESGHAVRSAGWSIASSTCWGATTRPISVGSRPTSNWSSRRSSSCATCPWGKRAPRPRPRRWRSRAVRARLCQDSRPGGRNQSCYGHAGGAW